MDVVKDVVIKKVASILALFFGKVFLALLVTYDLGLLSATACCLSIGLVVHLLVLRFILTV